MKKILLLLFICINTEALIYADQDTTNVVNDTLKVAYDIPDTSSFDDNFEANVDSLLNLYYVKESLKKQDEKTSEIADAPPILHDSIYRRRLEAIPSVAKLNYNNIVKRYIEVYTIKKRKNVEIMLGLSEHYFPLFDDIFDYYDVPNELKYMSIIESALNPRAYSRARAVGLWQFMYGTGRMYGLEINSLVDERRDPIKSTHAAVRYIKNLHSMYDDWLLAIAAYNCGPGNVNKAIRRAGGKKNFWEIYYYLPRETRGHVPAFIAATYTMHYFKEHNITPADIDLPVNSDTIMIHDKLHLEQVAHVLNIPIKQLQDLNPQYHYDIIPGNSKPYALRLPEQKALTFIDLKDSILAYKDSIYFNSRKVSAPTYTRTLPNMPGKDYVKLTYTVKSGDAVGLIAQWYNVKTNDLKYWNGIRRNLIRTGQKLKIYKHKSAAAKYRDINNLSYAEKQTRIGKTVTASSVSSNTSQTTFSGSDDSYVIYTVRNGDTIWEIAKRYPGVSDTDIMRLNNISKASSIRPGQKLRIKPKT